MPDYGTKLYYQDMNNLSDYINVALDKIEAAGKSRMSWKNKNGETRTGVEGVDQYFKCKESDMNEYISALNAIAESAYLTITGTTSTFIEIGDLIEGQYFTGMVELASEFEKHIKTGGGICNSGDVVNAVAASINTASASGCTGTGGTSCGGGGSNTCDGGCRVTPYYCPK